MYHSFIDDSGNEYGSFEVFEGAGNFSYLSDTVYPRGYYWWSCFPGCLPDSDPVGPFKTESDAITDATEV